MGKTIGYFRTAKGVPRPVRDFARDRIFTQRDKIGAREPTADTLSLELVLQRLHDSKINAGLQSFCFTGLTAWIGDPETGQAVEADLDTKSDAWHRVGSVGQWLHDTALGLYPDSEYPGEHAAIVSQSLWDKAQSILRESPRVRACRSRASTPALLKGLLFGPSGRAMSPTHTRRGGKLYRYYVCQPVLKGEVADTEIRRVSAASIEAAVIDQLRALLKSPEVVMATWRAATADGAEFSEAMVCAALERLDPLWEELFPAEQARIVQLLVQRIDLKPDGLELQLRTQGLGHVMRQLGALRRAT
jgi:hypothetical protein